MLQKGSVGSFAGAPISSFTVGWRGGGGCESDALVHLQFGRTPGGRGGFQAEDGTTRLGQVERLLFREGGKVLPAAAARFLLKQVKNKPAGACDAFTYRQDFASGDNVIAGAEGRSFRSASLLVRLPSVTRETRACVFA